MAIYVVELTARPGVFFEVEQPEYERLTELKLLKGLTDATAGRDEIVIQTTEPVNPYVGLVWFNPNVPF